MRKTIAAATVAASVTVGGVAGALLGAPGLAGAAETASGAAGWVQDALSELVEDGTIDQEQADAVATALDDARPEQGHHGFGWHLGLSSAAETLGVTEDELRAALRDGQTIAEVAADQGIEVQAVVDAIATALRERLDEAVTEGRLTQEEADERLAAAEELITAAVNGEVPMRDGGPDGGHGGHRREHPGWAGEGDTGGGDAGEGDAGDGDTGDTGDGDTGS